MIINQYILYRDLAIGPTSDLSIGAASYLTNGPIKSLEKGMDYIVNRDYIGDAMKALHGTDYDINKI